MAGYKILIKNYEGNRKTSYPLPTRYEHIADARKRAIAELRKEHGKWYYAKVYQVGKYGDRFEGEVHMHVYDGARWYPASGPVYTSGKAKLNKDGTIRYRLE